MKIVSYLTPAIESYRPPLDTSKIVDDIDNIVNNITETSLQADKLSNMSRYISTQPCLTDGGVKAISTTINQVYSTMGVTANIALESYTKDPVLVRQISIEGIGEAIMTVIRGVLNAIKTVFTKLFSIFDGGEADEKESKAADSAREAVKNPVDDSHKSLTIDNAKIIELFSMKGKASHEQVLSLLSSYLLIKNHVHQTGEKIKDTMTFCENSIKAIKSKRELPEMPEKKQVTVLLEGIFNGKEFSDVDFAMELKLVIDEATPSAKFEPLPDRKLPEKMTIVTGNNARKVSEALDKVKEIKWEKACSNIEGIEKRAEKMLSSIDSLKDIPDTATERIKNLKTILMSTAIAGKIIGQLQSQCGNVCTQANNYILESAKVANPSEKDSTKEEDKPKAE